MILFISIIPPFSRFIISMKKLFTRSMKFYQRRWTRPEFNRYTTVSYKEGQRTFLHNVKTNIVFINVPSPHFSVVGNISASVGVILKTTVQS